ncbi:hypothetical protein RGQ29_001496 [Quercus rubra]|uniref:Glycosyltransferase n=1 Tax=Quercus rubra TaxID=3512 RepID=A0AAN7GJ31_QUERU|nr:hypothetical protein RGQ29_001496 [Quercus rubra]
MDSKRERSNSISILMLPWLAHGHISPFLDLAKKLSLRNCHVYFCSTPINLKPVRESLIDKTFSSIQPVDLHLPYLEELPPQYHTTKDLPPHLMSSLKKAFDSAKPKFSNILKVLKPNLLIYDFMQPWAPVAAREENIEAVMLSTCGAAASSLMAFYSNNPGKEFPFQALNFPQDECEKSMHFLHYTANGITNKERYMQCIERSSNIILIKTSREIESQYIDYLSGLVGKEIVPVGPLVQEPAKNRDDDMVIVEWLNKKDPSSVVFVSFGSEYFLSLAEMEEIARGLELSKVSFIWVVRFHGGDKISIHEALPEGFLERIREKGMVVEGWAPQAKILGHSSIGGFMSHCGWSSTLEGMVFGVPIIAIPMRLDQPLNAKLVVEVGVGVEVSRENEKLKAEEVAKAIKKVMMQEEGKEVRKKAKELSQRMKDKDDGEMDVVVEKLVQLLGESRISTTFEEI